MGNISDKSFRENQNTYFRFSNIYFFENPSVYEITWKKNIVEPNRPQMTIYYDACYIQTHTQNIQYLLLSRCNDGGSNALEYYAIRTLPTFLD